MRNGLDWTGLDLTTSGTGMEESLVRLCSVQVGLRCVCVWFWVRSRSGFSVWVCFPVAPVAPVFRRLYVTSARASVRIVRSRPSTSSVVAAVGNGWKLG